jgi:tetratricopeptide (TPR) repeat protein
MKKFLILFLTSVTLHLKAQVDTSVISDDNKDVYTKGYQYLCARYFQEAAAYLAQARQLYPPDVEVEALYLYARYLTADSVHIPAILTRIDSLVHLPSPSLYAYAVKCHILFDQKYYDEAMIGFKSMVNNYNHRRDMYRCHFYIGYIYHLNGLRQDALRHLRLYNYGLEHTDDDYLNFLYRHELEYNIDEYIRAVGAE